MSKSSLFLVKKFRIISPKSLIYELLKYTNMEKFKKELVEETKVINERIDEIFCKFPQVNTEEELKDLLEDGICLRKQILDQSKRLKEKRLPGADEYIIRFNLTGIINNSKLEKFLNIDFEGIKKELGY